MEEATPLPLDNSPITGQIDFADDYDTIKITVTEGRDGNIVIRISDLALDMAPYLFVFSKDGSVDIEDYFEETPGNNDYLVVALNVTAGQEIYATVAHYDEEVEEGYYSISASPGPTARRAASRTSERDLPAALPTGGGTVR